MLGERIENELQPFSKGNTIYISAVTKGELLSFAKQVGWGKRKLEKLHSLILPASCIAIDGDSPLMDAYADIDAYSQAKHPEYLPPVAFSARNMGKNDLWIAATAFLFGLTLVTTDHDFDHLHPDFIEVVKF
jgi:tRNA(fMet)-specific endonuclease VapC